ncbi:SDR family NAD(P)-dependent oxidoreductase [Granulicella tundricola]|uniref:dTDP-4-dehydrorhamnose reductase n=1 Tax=Granulicella tundricola (strain ATCC BAA-1859 / DSM 23138 / MP5ACTX9) TaxID=1198114 RepID=E8WV92_GRATM|nr:SDR family oxidoreductase [Granulicella tundricola]ADW67267.1 dTDP-4-dehydrorhamnose reductase [Granulicella tundricola MP5ACTX9]
MSETPRLLLFGASGAIGTAILNHCSEKGWQVTAVSRKRPEAVMAALTWIEADPLSPTFDASILATNAPYTSVCWAQGANSTDSVYTVEAEAHLDLYKANCLYILLTLKALLDYDLLAPASRLCVISSIWQNLARQSKLSYCMTKAALQGLVLSASVDLAEHGHLINAVLPGVLDTPMTRRNLAPEQLEKLSGATKFNALPQLQDVANLVEFLCSTWNTGITGQFIAADLGYSHVRLV